MVLDGVRADVQQLADLLRASAFAYLVEDLPFTLAHQHADNSMCGPEVVVPWLNARRRSVCEDNAKCKRLLGLQRHNKKPAASRAGRG